jgi:collagenase-like PrtC family protease
MVNVSTIMSIYNKYQIEYLMEEYPFINRLVLPRELTLKEIEDLAAEFPKVQLEIFISGDKCWYSNGLCFTEHNTKN